MVDRGFAVGLTERTTFPSELCGEKGGIEQVSSVEGILRNGNFPVWYFLVEFFLKHFVEFWATDWPFSATVGLFFLIKKP